MKTRTTKLYKPYLSSQRSHIHSRWKRIFPVGLLAFCFLPNTCSFSLRNLIWHDIEEFCVYPRVWSMQQHFFLVNLMVLQWQWECTAVSGGMTWFWKVWPVTIQWRLGLPMYSRLDVSPKCVAMCAQYDGTAQKFQVHSAGPTQKTFIAHTDSVLTGHNPNSNRNNSHTGKIRVSSSSTLCLQ